MRRRIFWTLAILSLTVLSLALWTTQQAPAVQAEAPQPAPSNEKAGNTVPPTPYKIRIEPSTRTIPETVPGDWFPVSTSGILGDVAYNSGQEEYLVAWTQQSEQMSQSINLYVRVFDVQGQPRHPVHKIGAHRHAHTRIAYNPLQDEYLIAWDATDATIHTQRLNNKGERLGTTAQITTSNGTSELAQVTYCASQNTYLVLFNRFQNDASSTYGQIMQADGSPAHQFQISALGFLGHDLTYNLDDDVYLVVGVWQSDQKSWDIHGQFLTSAGAALGERFVIESDANVQDMPFVSWNSTFNEYMVIWRDAFQDNGTPDVYGRRLSRNGSTTGTYIPVAIDDFYQKYPNDLVYNPHNSSYLALWSINDERADRQLEYWSYALGIKSDGTIPMRPSLLWHPTAGHSAATYGPHQAYMLVLGINSEIRGRFFKVWEHVYLPLTARNYVSTFLPNDPCFKNGLQWGLHNTGQSDGLADADVDAPEAWNAITAGRTVTVAIIDSGIDLNHPEFSGRITAGWDFVHDDSTPQDDYGHGTHVAGILAAKGDNGIGVAGLAWDVKIMPIKVLDSDGVGQYSQIIAGIEYAIDHGAQVINLSLGGVSYSQAMQQAINDAYHHGVLIIAAAGNCGDQYYWQNGCSHQDQPHYPAAMDNVLAVASTTRQDKQSSFSNEGTYIDVAAPGSYIYSTGWTGDASSNCNGGYCYKNGTSMATPFVAGLAGLIYAQHPEYDPRQVAQAIVNNADELGTLGHDDVYGCGRINALRSLTNDTQANGCTGWTGLSTRVLPTATSAPADAKFRPGVLLVRFQDNVSPRERQQILRTWDLISQTVIQEKVYLVTVPQGQELVYAQKLNDAPTVAYAEPDYQARALSRSVWPDVQR